MSMCKECGVNFTRIGNLTRHKKERCCPGSGSSKMEVDIPTFSGSEFGTGKPKSEATMKKIERLVQSSRSSPHEKSRNRQDPVEQKPISFGELWCREEKGKKVKDDDDDDDEEEEEEKEEEVKMILPTSIDRLKKRFNKLFCEFMRQDKLENRNELVYLLEEMLTRDFISEEDFRALNNILAAQSLPIAMDGEEEIEVQDLKTLVKSTSNYAIEHEKNELDELIEEFKEGDNELALKLESLIEKVLNDHYNFEIVDDYDLIREILGNNSSIPKLKALRFKMLLNKIQRERYRINAILSRLDEIDGEEHFVLVLKSLAREGLLSEEQFKKFMEKDAVLELKSFISWILLNKGLIQWKKKKKWKKWKVET